ncbi:MAG TPA: zeta toxin family protein [Burkholderiales bacterium]|jgi:predicted ABC-type ATPase|nr:zeta toxin family protein [Burkholderiales bacterium]
MSEKPRLIVVAGPNGSGKTSITEQLLRHTWMEGCVYVNPDYIARDEFGSWNSPEAVLHAAQRAEEIRTQCISNMKSLAFETVLSAPDKVEFIHAAQQAGYFVRLFFIGTDHPAINAGRIAHRVMEGGHDVPIGKIISRYDRSIANCLRVAEFADRTYIYDNSVDYAQPKLLFRAAEGRVIRIYDDLRPWTLPIVSGLGAS